MKKENSVSANTATTYNWTIFANRQECFICNGKNYYKDNVGIWHQCPKCASNNYYVHKYIAPYTITSDQQPRIYYTLK